MRRPRRSPPAGPTSPSSRRISRRPQLAFEVKTGENVAQTAAFNDVHGYATAFSSPANGGTLSASAFSTTGHYDAESDCRYSLSLSAPASVSARVRITFSGTLTSLGSGFATASIAVGDYFEDVDYQELDYSTSATRHNMGFKGALTTYLNGGDAKPIDLSIGANTNRDTGFTTQAVGSAQAYLDPTVTIGGVPEPASWALLLAGFGAVGTVARRRRSVVA